MNRGSREILPRVLVKLYRFNEAPIHESGKSASPHKPPWTLRRFNEAPIHESGKSRGRSPRHRRRTRFNEAPIHESGKSITSYTVQWKSGAASMRPRFMNRGSATANSTANLGCLLLQ